MSYQILVRREIEEAVLVHCYLSNIMPLLDRLGIGDDHFAYPANKELYKIMRQIYKRGDMITIESIRDEIMQKESRTRNILLSKLVSLDDTCIVYDIMQVIDQLKKQYIKRQLVSTAYDIFSEAKGKSLSELFSYFQRAMKYMSVDNLKPATELKGMNIDIYNTLPQIEEILAINPADLVIIAGRPSKGKSALLLTLALAMQVYNPCIFSAEMSEYAIKSRLISMIYRKPINQIINNPAWNDIKIDLPIVFDFTPRVSTSDVYMKTNEAYHKYNSRLVMVDYLQLLTTTTEKRVSYSRSDYVGKIAQDLKMIAKDFDVPVIACSQLNRRASGDDQKVSLADLRDSGEIEQVADSVIAIHNNGCLEVLKQRNGATGLIKGLKFVKEYFTWE